MNSSCKSCRILRSRIDALVSFLKSRYKIRPVELRCNWSFSGPARPIGAIRDPSTATMDRPRIAEEMRVAVVAAVVDVAVVVGDDDDDDEVVVVVVEDDDAEDDVDDVDYDGTMGERGDR